MTLVQTLADGPIDIIGDIHGEYDALERLLHHLGYTSMGTHPQGRKIVFIGDFCDRGPSSVSVIELVQHLMAQGTAHAILGNHEINVLCDDPKDGSGWYFDSRYTSDLPHYAPFERATQHQKSKIKGFLNTLPVALERSDIRIIHATWDTQAVDAIRTVPLGQVASFGRSCRTEAQKHAKDKGLWDRYQNDLRQWKTQLENKTFPPPFLHSVADYDALWRHYDPIKVVTSGIEEKTTQPFFAGNRWRFSDRLPWWNHYTDAVPVVIGHYWRLYRPSPDQPQSRYSMLFNNIPSTAWHGMVPVTTCFVLTIRSVRAGGIVYSNVSKNQAPRPWDQKPPDFVLPRSDGQNGHSCSIRVR